MLPLQQLTQAINRAFGDRLTAIAVCDLARHKPEFSAGRAITQRQIICALIVMVLCVCVFIFAGGITHYVLSGVLAVCFAANAGLRALLTWKGAGEHSPMDEPVCATPFSGRELEWPIYTIIVPMYREANVMANLVHAILALDYPRNRLDVKLVLEADDAQTYAAAKEYARDPCFEIIRVPPSQPRTKPKAANYALQFARGAYIVIYDAEDRPEPDQLKKALAMFRQSPDNVACLQARLNFYNADENWLTRMFALDYALWFDFLLPGLDRLGIPMPLGGTSNHFRTQALRAIHGWDPYNVTEDADIGIRLSQMGFRVRTLDSTTYEEAVTQLGVWLGQRSRWMKGYIQTWLVHMRKPRALLHNAGAHGFAGFQLFVGGTPLAALLNPLLWLLFCVSLVIYGPAALTAGGGGVALCGLILGNALFTYLMMLGVLRRGWLSLAPFGLCAPLYWLLISVAAYRGVFELLYKPWHWQKTDHGLSRITPPNQIMQAGS
ncbi:MAG TPA: glycosyltransferase [Rhizomicrobium sp.]|nr:glycosyltransferase [Rhizomicrobium sp.]